MNELATLQEAWKESPVQHFSNSSELETWEKNWPNGDGRPAAKIIYDPAAGEVRVSGRSRGKFFQRTFPLEKDLATTLQQVESVHSRTNEKMMPPARQNRSCWAACGTVIATHEHEGRFQGVVARAFTVPTIPLPKCRMIRHNPRRAAF